MRYLTKLISLLLALTMVTALAATVCATTTHPGSIQIDSAQHVSVGGKTFNAYKILDVEGYSGSGSTIQVAYTVPAEMKSFYKTRYPGISETAPNYDVLVVEAIRKEGDQFAFAAAALDAARKAYTAPTGSATAADGASSVTISNLPLGFYVVEEAVPAGTALTAPISALILDTTTPTASVTLKADQPTVDKTMADGSKHGNAAVGDSVSYKVTSKVPNMTGYEKYYFVVNDTLSAGLTFQEVNSVRVGMDSLQRVYVKSDSGTFKYYQDPDHNIETTNANAYTLAYTTDPSTGKTSVEIVFVNFIQYKRRTDESITIEYSATLNEKAVIGTGGNANEVTLTYSNDPNTKDGGDPENPDKPTPTTPTGTTPKSETRTYVTGITLKKVDPDGKALTGAKFEISGTKTNIVLVTGEVYVADVKGTYWLLKDETYTQTDPSGDNVDQSVYKDTATRYSKKTVTTPVQTTDSVTATAFVDGNGILKFEGLSAGDYTINELKAPGGYNLLKQDIQVTIGWEAPETNKTDCKWTYAWTIGAGDTANGENGTVTVTNQAGAQLPSTGGIGTTVFYVIGSILLVVAGVLLVAKRRMDSEK